MKPIFIGGCERSGTTLLGAMLGAHPRYLCVPEMKFKIDVLSSSGNGADALVEPVAILKKLVRRSSYRIWELDQAVDSATRSKVSGREFIEWTVTAYGQKVGKPSPTTWVDHTPSNIRYVWPLLQVFPDAHLVHIVRDGRAVAASLLPLDWGPNEIEVAARYWAERLAFGFAAEARWPSKVTRVQYEELVQDPEVSLKKLCDALALDYDPAMCQGTGFRMPRYTANQHALVGTLPNVTRIDAWEQQLLPRQIEIFESIVADLLLSLGYPLRFGVHAQKMSRQEATVSTIREFYKREWVNRRRKRNRKRTTIAP